MENTVTSDFSKPKSRVTAARARGWRSIRNFVC